MKVRGKNEDGYALLLIVFLTALILVSTMSIGLRVLTEGRREQEQEMIWRGKQYTRGIKLYYQKLGRFPNSMDDLVKPKIGNIRFMRQAYKDPMNKEDGSWRLIYVGPAGQLIGSLKPQQTGIQMPGAPGQPAAGGIGAASSGTGFGSQASSTSGFSSTGTSTGTASASAAGTGASTQGTDTTGTGTDSQDVPMGDTPTIIGGNIIGVGSKVNHPSIIVYEKAKNYRLFEFIWDPSKDLGMIGGQSGAIGTPAGTPGAPGTPGQSPFGGQPNPMAPQPMPPTSAPNPNPNPQQQQ
jgi:hypothetical protein